jgi:oligopeptide transport system substrate-binding protein
MKGKKLSLLFVALLVFAMAACSGGSKTVAKEKVFRWVMAADTATLNAHFLTNVSQDLYNYVSSGLYLPVPTPDGKSVQFIPNLADSDPQMMDRDGKVWRINIRKEAKWHNGDPINADTFVYSYKMLLDPILVNRMATFIYDYYIKIVNAREYYFQAQAGNTPVAWEDVGIKKVGDYAIEFTLTEKSNMDYVKRHFTDRSTFPVYEPYYEAGMNAERTTTTWAATLDQFMGCGPYFYDRWDHDAEHIFIKNPNHWLSSYFKFDRIEVRIVPDRNARVQMFQNGEIDYLELDSVTLPTFRDDPRVRTYTGITPYHFDINAVNTNNPILANPNFRKALYYVVDRKTIGELCGTLPSPYYINHQAPGYDGMVYRDTPEAKAIVPPNYGYDPVLAKRYFETALAEMHMNKASVELIFSEADPNAKVMAEFFEQSWPKVLGADKFTLVIRQVPETIAWTLNKWRITPNGFELGFNDFGSSLSRVFTYAALQYFRSAYTASPNSYFTPAFDAAYQFADTEAGRSDPHEMTRRTAALEKIYIDDVINVPLYQQLVHAMYSDKIVLPCPEYVPILAFGATFADKITD